jgi:methyl coenzyme M reductase subunit C-like uncharacterized protein (methanogenesis marker protein 7)
VKSTAFPRHTLSIFQLLDPALSNVFKHAKKHLMKNAVVPMMVNHAPDMFKARESAETSSSVPGAFIHAE